MKNKVLKRNQNEFYVINASIISDAESETKQGKRGTGYRGTVPRKSYIKICADLFNTMLDTED